MFACTADGKMLNPNAVYKVEHLHDQRIQGGSRNVRYNRSGIEKKLEIKMKFIEDHDNVS